MDISKTLMVGSSQFQISPFISKYYNEKTPLGIYAGRSYAINWGEDPEIAYGVLRRKSVLFDVPEDEQEERRVQYSGLLKDINGKNVPGTEHPVNYYVITDPKVLENNNEKADGIFSIKDNKWIKKPDEDTFEPEKYEIRAKVGKWRETLRENTPFLNVF